MNHHYMHHQFQLRGASSVSHLKEADGKRKNREAAGRVAACNLKPVCVYAL